jgi:uncharacterized protein
MSSLTVRDIAPELLKEYRPFATPKGVNLAGSQHAAIELATVLAGELKERFKAVRVVLFGSATRVDFSQWSDIDLAVWGIAPSEYFRAVAYVSGVSSRFKVDLIDAEDCALPLLQHIEMHGVEL